MLRLRISDSQIDTQIVRGMKYLEAYPSNTLSWALHVGKIVRPVNYIAHLRAYKYLLLMSARVRLISLLIITYIDYRRIALTTP